MPDDDPHKFSVGQRAATAAAFKLAGYQGELLVAPITSEDRYGVTRQAVHSWLAKYGQEGLAGPVR